MIISLEVVLKKLLHILFFLSLFLITAFPQVRIQRGVIPERFTAERLLEMHQSNVGGLKGIDDRESLLLESESSNWQTALRNPQRDFYEEEGINAKNTRTTINKTLLGNGFLLIDQIEQGWNGSEWMNSGRSLYTYDGNNNLTELLGESWDGSAWVNGSKNSFTYDINNNQIESLGESWNGSAWVNYHRHLYMYDGNNNQTEDIYQEWDGSAWVNVHKDSYIYDINNNETEWLYQNWSASVWMNIDKHLYSYDVNNNKTEDLYQNWSGSLWVNSYKTSYTYLQVTAVNEDRSTLNSYNLSNNYPNPFNPNTKISWQLPDSSQVSLKVYDVLGNEIITLVNEEKPAGSYEVDFNASQLSSGVYFYRLSVSAWPSQDGQAGSFVQTRKMTLLK